MFRFLIGQVLLLLALILGIVMIGGWLITWLHPAPMAVIFVVILPLLAVLCAHPFGELRQAFRDAFQPSAHSRSNATSLKVWRLLETCVYFGGVLAFFTGLMITLTFLGSNSLEVLGVKLAATCVAPFYSVLLAMTCRLLGARVALVA